MNALKFAISVLKRTTHNPTLTLTESRVLLLIADGHCTTAAMGKQHGVGKEHFAKACKDLRNNGFIKTTKITIREHTYALTNKGFDMVKYILSI